MSQDLENIEVTLERIRDLYDGLVVESNMQFHELCKSPAINMDRAKALGSIVDARAPLEELISFISCNGEGDERKIAALSLNMLLVLLVENLGFGLESPLSVEEALQRNRDRTEAARLAAARSRNLPTEAEHTAIVHEIAAQAEAKRGAKYIGTANALAKSLKKAVNEKRAEKNWPPVSESRIRSHLKDFIAPKSEA